LSFTWVRHINRSLCDGSPQRGKKVFDRPFSMDSRTTMCLYLCSMRKLISDMNIHLPGGARPIPGKLRASKTYLYRMSTPINHWILKSSILLVRYFFHRLCAYSSLFVVLFPIRMTLLTQNFTTISFTEPKIVFSTYSKTQKTYHIQLWTGYNYQYILALYRISQYPLIQAWSSSPLHLTWSLFHLYL